MIYTYLGVLCGFSFVILSMAEMASMCDTLKHQALLFSLFMLCALMIVAASRNWLLTIGI